jgi:hypothetical protein
LLVDKKLIVDIENYIL